VITIYEPFACYRLHDANDSMQDAITAARFKRMARYFACKLDYLAQRCKFWESRSMKAAPAADRYLVPRMPVGCGPAGNRQGARRRSAQRLRSKRSERDSSHSQI
jgi:hypothetical protein